MRHRKSGRKFGMDASARKAMLKNMVTSLLLHGSVRTTQARAKELRGYAERVITMGKKGSNPGLSDDAENTARRVHLIRQARVWVNNDEAIANVFGEYAERFAGRPGGYTRVVKAGKRPGDNADMAIISLVGGADDIIGKITVAGNEE